VGVWRRATECGSVGLGGTDRPWGQGIVYHPPLFNRLGSPYSGASFGASNGESMGVEGIGRYAGSVTY
jgi:hypothetical protein